MKVSVFFLLVIFLATCQAEDTRMHPKCEGSPPQICDPKYVSELAYYDHEKKKCVTFIGCYQPSVFASLEVCHDYCEKTPEEVCRTPLSYKEGERECYANTFVYSYEPSEKKCTKIGYGGCGGSSNQFYTLKECENYCANV